MGKPRHWRVTALIVLLAALAVSGCAPRRRAVRMMLQESAPKAGAREVAESGREGENRRSRTARLGEYACAARDFTVDTLGVRLAANSSD